MPQSLELNARQIAIIDEDGAQTVEVIEPLLGLTPYVLLYCEELDPLDTPVFRVRYGGGLSLADLPPLMKSLYDNLVADAAAEGIDLTQSTGGADGQDQGQGAEHDGSRGRAAEESTG